MSPITVEGGELDLAAQPPNERVTVELKQQCTACSHRFDCKEYTAYLGRKKHPDIDIYNIRKN